MKVEFDHQYNIIKNSLEIKVISDNVCLTIVFQCFSDDLCFPTFDLQFYEVAGIFQALLHLTAIVARVTGAHISQPQ